MFVEGSGVAAICATILISSLCLSSQGDASASAAIASAAAVIASAAIHFVIV